MPERLFIIDAHAHIFQAYYALPPLATSSGLVVNAAYGFAGMMRKLIAKHTPEYLVVAMDTPARTFRHELFPAYKANRTEAPEDLVQQIPVVERIVRAHGIPILTLEGYEADDVIGTLTRKAEAAGLDVVIVSTDKDIEQLLGPHVRILQISKDKWVDVESLKADKGISPNQVVDVLALAGDSSDNIPGVPGIGPKTAQRLVSTYGSLGNAVAHADEIKSKRQRESIQRAADSLKLYRELVTIRTDLDLDVDLKQCRLSQDTSAAVEKLYQELEFKALRGAGRSSTPKTKRSRAKSKRSAATASLLTAPAESISTRKHSYRLVNTADAFGTFLAELSGQKRFSIDLETTSTEPVEADIVGLSFSWKPAEAYYLPVRGPEGAELLDIDSTLEALRPILEDPDVAKVGQNIKYDMIVLRSAGVSLPGVRFDTMVASHLIFPNRPRHNLGDMAAEYLNYTTIPIEALIGKGRNQLRMDQVQDVELLRDYACEDADIALALAEYLEPRLRERDLSSIFESVEIPLVPVLAEMELSGVCIEAEQLHEFSRELGRQIENLRKRIHESAGGEFNINSTKQLREVLFDKLGLPPGRRTQTGSSTGAEVLQELSQRHPLPGLVLEYRQLSKLKSTYADALPKMISKRTGRLHTSFHQTGTATGRLSSSEPNLQNIPVRTQLGLQIRKAFVAPGPDWLLVSADYSQIELRMLAHFSGDEALVRAFRQDRDIHRFVAAEIAGVHEDRVTPEMRTNAKATNFGIIYGQGAPRLSRETGLSLADAQAFIKAYFERYKGVRKFIDTTIKRAHRDGFVRTLTGRKRPLPNIRSSNARLRAAEERIAVNTVLQGSAAELIKTAMVRLHARLPEASTGARLVLQIHDELLLESPKTDLEAVSRLLSSQMSSAMELSVPLKVNVSSGPNWMEAK